MSTGTSTVGQRLLATGCPYLEGMEDAVALEVLLSPGEARARALQWLLARFHPRLKDLLFATESSMATVPQLTVLFSDLGLCSREDYETVRGATPRWKQMQFLEALMDLLSLVETSPFADDSLVQRDSLAAHAHQCASFVHAVAQQENLSEVFQHTVSLVPPDIAKYDLASVQLRENVGDKRSLSELRRELECAEAQLETRQAELEQILDTHTYAPPSTSASENALKALSVSLSTLNQLLTNFCHTYETELQPWTNRTPPQLSSLGPTGKRLCSHLRRINELFQSLAQLESALDKLARLQFPPRAQLDELYHNVQISFKGAVDVLSSLS